MWRTGLSLNSEEPVATMDWLRSKSTVRSTAASSSTWKVKFLSVLKVPEGTSKSVVSNISWAAALVTICALLSTNRSWVYFPESISTGVTNSVVSPSWNASKLMVRGVSGKGKEIHPPPGLWTSTSSKVIQSSTGSPGMTGLASVIFIDSVPEPPPEPPLPPQPKRSIKTVAQKIA